MPKDKFERASEGENMKTILATAGTAVVYTSAALVFLYATFVTAAYQTRFENLLDKRLERIEAKIDQILKGGK